jgi:tRNA nucleotidyltransferase (CCA-adding enzyme)
MDVFAAERSGDPWEDQVVGFAVLCHDLGKPATSAQDGDSGRIRSPGHEQAGEEPTRSFLGRFTDQRDLIDQVVPLVREHLKPLALYEAGAGDAAIRRLARRVGRIDRLVRVARADALGRPPRSTGAFPAGDWLLQRARELAVEKARPRPLIQGRDLVALGLAPGAHFKAILAACYEAQLDGRFATLAEGRAYAKRLVAEMDPGAGTS